MELYKIPINDNHYFYTLPAPISPEGLTKNIENLRSKSISTLVSLLSTEEIEEYRLMDEESVCNDLNIHFIRFPISDFSTATNELEFIGIAKLLKEKIINNEIVGIHCKAGIGRSSLLAAAILLLFNFNKNEVFNHISKYRKTKVPDKQSQADWLIKLSEKF